MGNTHGGVLLLGNLGVQSATLLKVTLLDGCFFLRFLSCANGAKSRKAFHMHNRLKNHKMPVKCCLYFIWKSHPATVF